MTRGQLVLITTSDGDFVYPEEFNGDMDPPYRGKTAINRLRKCKSYKDFDTVCKKFLKEFNYIDEYTQEDLNSEKYMDTGSLSKGEFIPYSEYTYILNISGTDFPCCANDMVTVYKRSTKIKEYSLIK